MNLFHIHRYTFKTWTSNEPARDLVFSFRGKTRSRLSFYGVKNYFGMCSCGKIKKLYEEVIYK